MSSKCEDKHAKIWSEYESMSSVIAKLSARLDDLEHSIKSSTECHAAPNWSQYKPSHHVPDNTPIRD